MGWVNPHASYRRYAERLKLKRRTSAITFTAALQWFTDVITTLLGKHLVHHKPCLEIISGLEKKLFLYNNVYKYCTTFPASHNLSGRTFSKHLQRICSQMEVVDPIRIQKSGHRSPNRFARNLP